MLWLLAILLTPAPTIYADWKQVKIPDAWKTPAPLLGGYGWYRCVVQVPAEWKGQAGELFVEPVDDAREIYLNGTLVGRAGSFPPQFRSGLGSADRHPVPMDVLRAGEPNVLAIRVYDSDGRGGFNVGAPVLFVAEQAIRCEGTWQFQPGDQKEWSTWTEPAAPPNELIFSRLMPRGDAERLLRRLPGEEGPQTPAEALQRLETPDDLKVELALAEPDIGQPLFVQFDERGRLWVMNYLQYPNPAGLSVVSRDKFLRSVYDQIPPPPPRHIRGADKITIHEDTDGDGRFDAHRTFVDGLNLATSFARGRGGVWVLNPPYLLFYPDENRDDVPDGDPVVHLEGFGLEDSHSLANNLCFGPDGWLYGAQGSTVTGNIRRYGTQDKPVFSMGQLIWRYHPTLRRYEIYAEGGGNTFGVEIDSKGRVFSGHNGGDTRGFHYVQGGYYQKGFGKHGELSNPYAFGYFPQMAHHSVPRFNHALIVYEGAALSAHYAGKLFGIAPLQGYVVVSDMEPVGATFKTKDLSYALTSKDPWFRPVHIALGPDGAIYVSDFYEQRIDHASHYQGRVDKKSGRIYRLRAAGEVTPQRPFDYGQATSAELVRALSHENRWHRDTALRVLGDRADVSVLPSLLTLVEGQQGQLALEALWAVNLLGGLDDANATRFLRHADPFVRLWTARLLGDRNQTSAAVAAELAELAKRETNVESRVQLACTSRRLPAGQGLPIVRNLLAHDADAQDSFLPLLLWWSLETHVTANPDAVLALFEEGAIWDRPIVAQQLLERLMRRFAQAGGQKDLARCAKLLALAPDSGRAAILLKGFETAFAGRSLTGLPTELTAAIAKAGGGSLILRLRTGDAAAVTETLRQIQDRAGPAAQRVALVQVLGQVTQPSCVPVLLKLAADGPEDDLRAAAISSLQSYDHPSIPISLVELTPKLPEKVRDVALSTLTSRRAWAGDLVAAAASGSIPAAQVPRSIVQRILFLKDEDLAAKVKAVWGEVQDASSDEMRRQVEHFTQVIATGAGNPYKGKRLFDQNCGKCHVLFNVGGQIGPDLTSYKRDDLRGMLMNVVNPSLQIREGYENFVVITNDGRTLNGFVTDQDNRVIVLKQADGQAVLIPRDEIEEMGAIPRSIMPEELLKDYNEQQVRDLFA